jgi:hypothetical protein
MQSISSLITTTQPTHGDIRAAILAKLIEPHSSETA